MQSKQIITVAIAVAVLIFLTAGATALITRNNAPTAAPAPVSPTLAQTAPVQTAPVQTAPAQTAPAARIVHHKYVSNHDDIRWNDSRAAAVPMTQVQPAAPPPCNDHNIVGDVVGAAAGGLAGNQFGKGKGKIATTVLGVAGGAVAGNQLIPTQNVTCR